MAGLGFKDFQVGEVLTAADVDGYLMQQSVMRFASSAARGSALGTATGTAVPLAEGMVTYLDDINQVQRFDGVSWKTVGSILQVVSTEKTDAYTTTGTAFATVTGLNASLTPSSTSSKILVVLFMNVGSEPSVVAVRARLRRNSSDIFIGDASSSRTRVTFDVISGGGGAMNQATVVYLDSPNTTSAVTYDVQISGNTDNLVSVNRSRTDTNSAVNSRGVSSITLMEVAA